MLKLVLALIFDNLDVKASLYVSCPLAFGAGSPILVYCTVVAFMSCRPCRVVLSEFLCLVEGVRELATFSRGFPTLGEPANWLFTPATLMKETVGQQTIYPPPRGTWLSILNINKAQA